MFKVAICDSNMKACTEIESIILMYGKRKHIFVEVDIYYHGENLIRYLNMSYYTYDLILINTKLRGMGGIQVGRRIREKYWVDVSSIVFFSNDTSELLQLIEIMPISFVSMPISSGKLERVMDLALLIMDKNKHKLFSYRIAGITYKVLLEDVLYFESNNKIVNIYTRTEVSSFYSTLGDIEQKLRGHDFLPIHKSYLVNGDHVIRYHYDKVIMSNMVELPISQTRRKEMRTILTG